MTEVLDYIEHASGVLHPVMQIYRVASFIYRFVRTDRNSAMIGLGASDYGSELTEHQRLLNKLILEVESHRARALTQLDWLAVDRDFLGAQIDLARGIAENRDFNASIRGRAAGTVLDLQSMLMSRFPISLAINASTPILVIRPLPLPGD